MNIAIGSAFRNAAGPQVERFLRQVCALSLHAGKGHRVRVIAAEGDSVDGTAMDLVAQARHLGVPLELIVCAHGGPWFGSTETPERMAALTKVGNAILCGVRPDDDVLVYVESDLLWDAHTIGSLVDIAHERRHGADVVAPLVFAGELFYDIYAFRKGGRRFSPFPPYHPDLRPNGLTSVDSAGSCLVMRAEIAREVQMPDGGVLVGWCDAARQRGHCVAVHTGFSVRHPA